MNIHFENIEEQHLVLNNNRNYLFDIKTKSKLIKYKDKMDTLRVNLEQQKLSGAQMKRINTINTSVQNIYYKYRSKILDNINYNGIIEDAIYDEKLNY